MDTKIFHIKEVLGKNSKPFILYKFRTMIPGADSMFFNLLEKNGIGQNGKINCDPRITKTGRILRKYFLDEVPEIYNILRGEMSMVGIRPRTEKNWRERFPEEHKIKALRYKPGLMGVPYYYDGLESISDIVEAEDEYLARKEKDPVRTDIHYRNRIISRIIFNGLRSS